MFNSTHTLLGLAAARTGTDRWVACAATTAVIASNLPDIDILTGLNGTAAYLDYHRGITHSFIGVPILSLVLALAMWRFTGNFRRTFVLAFLVMATHPLLDYSNTYGFRPFLPFDGTWYYGDTLFVIDPYIDGILLVGILGGTFFKRARGTFAVTSILLVLIYAGARIQFRMTAVSDLARFTANMTDVERTAVMPRLDTPLIWTGIVETKDEVFQVDIDTLEGVNREYARMLKGRETAITAAAEVTSSVAVLHRFARFPVFRVEGMPDGYRVILADFRFYRDATQSALAAVVLLDNSLHVIQESLGFDRALK